MGRPRKNMLETAFTEAEIDDTSTIQMEESKVPNITSPGWSDYVLSHLTDDEKDKENGYPKTDALKRLVEKLMGPIINSKSTIAVEPGGDNGQKVIVEHHLEVHDYQLGDEMSPYGLRQVTAVAEASELQLKSPYNLYPAAVASTRALGRALRTILQLKNVTVAEEIAGSVSEDGGDEFQTITSNQIQAIEAVCKRINVDVKNFLLVETGKTDYNTVSKAQAIRLITKLTQYEHGQLDIAEGLRVG